MPAAAAASGWGVWSRRSDEITFDRLQKFWHDLPPQARQDLLKLYKQTLIEHARKNSYCSRCYGLLLDCFAQIAIYGKSLRQEDSDLDLSRATSESRVRQMEQDRAQDPSVHPWGGLSTTKDDILTLLDCFIKSKSLKVLQNVFDNALARERERKMRYPDACSAGGRGYGTREMCALHTARPSCDTLVDFWSPLGEETRSSLLRMREEDFIEKLTRRFNRKKFCRDCRKNVIREFKELKEPKRMRRERRCSCWFCVDNGFQCEVFEDGIIVDWSQCLSEADGSFHHFEWAIGTHEGESDIFGFEDVGMNVRVHKTGINLLQFENYFITLRACRPDGRCTEYCVKAHVLKDKSCVHLQHTLVVSDGFVTITNGESMKSFFERAEKVEEEDEDSAMDRDGNDLDADGSHTQKHAKTPELAREFLLDAASVIFKEQIVKAFRDGTAQQNAKTVFVSLALKLLEERVHVACKELITLEKQNKLLEEEEKEMREELERRMKRKMKEREKKHRQKQKLKEKGKGAKLVESKSPDDIPALNNSSTSTNHERTDTPCSRDSANTEIVDLCSPGRIIDQSSCQENSAEHCNEVTELSATGSSDCCCTSEHTVSQDEPGRIGDSQWQSIERKRRSARSQQLHHQSMHLSPNSSATMRLHSHCWASPTNRNFQNVNCQVRYSNVNPYSYLAHQHCHMHADPIQKAAASFRSMPSSPPCRSGAKQIADHPHRDMNLERHPSNKLKPLGKNNLPEDNGKTQDPTDASFSLFQFSLPIASPVPPSSEGDKSGEFGDRMPLAQVQAQLCSNELTDVKEYELFSTKDSGIFSFMQIK